MADWTPVTESLPQPGRTVLAYYTNRCNKGRTIRAVWIPAGFEEADPEQEHVEYDEAKDCYFTPEGWYEQIDNWDDYMAVAVHEGQISHWQPMPAAPGVSAVDSVPVPPSPAADPWALLRQAREKMLAKVSMYRGDGQHVAAQACEICAGILDEALQEPT